MHTLFIYSGSYLNEFTKIEQNKQYNKKYMKSLSFPVTISFLSTIVMLFSLQYSLNAQDSFLKQGTPSTSEFLYERNSRIGLWTIDKSTPGALFHIKTAYTLSYDPVFSTESIDSHSGHFISNVSFNGIFNYSGTDYNYSILQKGIIGQNNIFLSPTIMGNDLTIIGRLTTSIFSLDYNANPGWVLTSSDDKGNGVWTDPSSFKDDDWLPNPPDGKSSIINLYLGPRYTNVGIGTRDPLQLLHVCGGNILISKPLDDAPGSENGSIYFGGVVTPEYPNGEWGIEYYHEGLNFWKVNTDSGLSGNFQLFLRNDGNVGIGTEETYDYKLAIAGRALCEEIKVKLVADWPDYVFDKNHKLPSLQDVDRFISEHKHLPDVPSSQEVRENGINVGEMNAILLKKVEELTLYVIAMEKEMEQLRTQIKIK